MKSFRLILFGALILFTLSSCKLWNNLFGPKYGCKTDGKNIGAERVLNGDAESMKAAKKAKKFKD